MKRTGSVLFATLGIMLGSARPAGAVVPPSTVIEEETSGEVAGDPGVVVVKIPVGLITAVSLTGMGLLGLMGIGESTRARKGNQ